MTVVRGQIYQFDLNPLVFFSIQRIYSVNQILIMNMDTHTQTYFTQDKLLSTCTLVDSLPPNRIHNGYDWLEGTVSIKAYALTTPFTSGRVQSQFVASHPRAFAPTYLHGRAAFHGRVQGIVVNQLTLGGHLAAQGRVVQAQADQG